MPLTLSEKVWRDHVVVEGAIHEADLLYIDLHLLHEVTSPQAFEGLVINGRSVRKPANCVATEDHNVPTDNIEAPIADVVSREQVETLRSNAAATGIKLHQMGSPGQGIVHVIGPEQGLTLPGMTIVCGDSHTSTHGAFGAIAFGIGTSEVEHVLATQTLPQLKPKTMEIVCDTPLPDYASAKDLILAIIGQIGTGGGKGHIIEYRGRAFSGLSMEGRMTVANMSIEAGAKAGMIAPDEITIDYLAARTPLRDTEHWEAAVENWLKLPTDPGAMFSSQVAFDASALEPQVTWGTNPSEVVSLSDTVPEPATPGHEKSLEYMGLTPGAPIAELAVDVVFIGSCTNSRIEDLRQAATVVEGRSIADTVRGLVVPGSKAVKDQAEAEGLAEVFIDAGFSWREPGCSMCLGMNPDQLSWGERCASTSNRNFEGRQGDGGRTHLVSPAVAAATAVAGHFEHPANLG